MIFLSMLISVIISCNLINLEDNFQHNLQL